MKDVEGGMHVSDSCSVGSRWMCTLDVVSPKTCQLARPQIGAGQTWRSLADGAAARRDARPRASGRYHAQRCLAYIR